MTTLTNNAAALHAAIQFDTPETVLVRDGGHRGTLLTWVPDVYRWIVYSLDGRGSRGEIDRLAVVTLDPSADPQSDAAERGLNQSQVACDMEVSGGEWIVDADELDSLREVYGEDLIVLWEQAD